MFNFNNCRGEELANLLAKIILFVISCIVGALVAAFISMAATASSAEQEALSAVCDTPAGQLAECEGECAECGTYCTGINGELICRNPECDLYGTVQEAPVE